MTRQGQVSNLAALCRRTGPAGHPDGLGDDGPAALLEGPGRDIDSVAFWSDGTDRSAESTQLFVTVQENALLEVWRFPFGQRPVQVLSLPEGSLVNGVVADPIDDRLYVSAAIEQDEMYEVHSFSLPELEPLGRFGRGIVGRGETNLAVLHPPDGPTRVYVSDDHSVHIFRIEQESATAIGRFAPPVSEIETVLADDYSQRFFIPEERGAEGRAPGIHVFDPNGIPVLRDDSNVFGASAVFQEDAEGIALYRCRDAAGTVPGAHSSWYRTSVCRGTSSRCSIVRRGSTWPASNCAASVEPTESPSRKLRCPAIRSASSQPSTGTAQPPSSAGT